MTLGNLRLNPKTWNKSYVNITSLCSSYVFVFIPATEHNLIVRSTKQLTTAFIDINSLEVMNGLYLGCIISVCRVFQALTPLTVDPLSTEIESSCYPAGCPDHQRRVRRRRRWGGCTGAFPRRRFHGGDIPAYKNIGKNIVIVKHR